MNKNKDNKTKVEMDLKYPDEDNRVDKIENRHHCWPYKKRTCKICNKIVSYLYEEI